jgi:hypothetical protein
VWKDAWAQMSYFQTQPFKMDFFEVPVWNRYCFIKVCQGGIETWLSLVPSGQLYSFSLQKMLTPSTTPLPVIN